MRKIGHECEQEQEGLEQKGNGRNDIIIHNIKKKRKRGLKKNHEKQKNDRNQYKSFNNSSINNSILRWGELWECTTVITDV